MNSVIEQMRSTIAIVTPVFPPYRGGIGTLAELDARQLAALGFDVHVYMPAQTGGASGIEPASEATKAMETRAYAVHQLRPWLRYGNAAFVPQVKRLLETHDAVLLHYPFFGASEPLAFAKGLGAGHNSKGRLLLMYHMDVIGSGLLRTFFATHTRWLMPRILRRAEKILVTSFDYARNSNVAQQLAATPKRFAEMPPAVDTARFAPGPKSAVLMARYGLLASDRVIVQVGGLDKAHYFKGVTHLLEALASPALLDFDNFEWNESSLRSVTNHSVRESQLISVTLAPRVKAVLVGSGDMRPQFEEKARELGIADRVIFTGSVSDAELADHYRLADVFAFPSIDKSEAFGIAALEAAACGIPAVASDLPGVRTVVRDGLTGVLVPPRDSAALASALATMLGDGERRQALGEAARAMAVNKYSEASRLERWRGLMSELQLTAATTDHGPLLKILYASNLYGYNARGGAERVVEHEARAMMAAGNDVVVVSAGRHEESVESVGAPRLIRYVAPNLYFYSDDYRHGKVTRLAWHLIDIFNDTSAHRFAAILKAERPDVVHTHNLMGLGFLIPAAIRRAGIRHIHTVHDVQLLHPSGLLPQGARVGRDHSDDDMKFEVTLVQKAYIALMRSLMGSPDTVIFPSEFLRKLHERHGFFPHSRKVVVINPVPAVRTQLRGGNLVQKSSLRFLFVGQIEQHKGIYVLADAWEKSGLHATTGATLEFVGEGAQAHRLAERLKFVPGALMLGKLTGDSLNDAYDRALFVVVPSIVIENQPTVILEAMSRGVPVVAVSSGGIPEIVAEGKTGFLCAADDAEALAATLRHAATVASDPEKQAAMSAACLEWAEGRGIEAHVAALQQAYGIISSART